MHMCHTLILGMAVADCFLEAQSQSNRLRMQCYPEHGHDGSQKYAKCVEHMSHTQRRRRRCRTFYPPAHSCPHLLKSFLFQMLSRCGWDGWIIYISQLYHPLPCYIVLYRYCAYYLTTYYGCVMTPAFVYLSRTNIVQTCRPKMPFRSSLFSSP